MVNRLYPPKNKKVLRRCFRGRCSCVIGSDVAVPTRPSPRSADTDWGYVVKVQEIKKRSILRCYRQPQVNGSSERENAQGMRDGAVTLSLTRDPATQLNTLQGLFAHMVDGVAKNGRCAVEDHRTGPKTRSCSRKKTWASRFSGPPENKGPSGETQPPPGACWLSRCQVCNCLPVMPVMGPHPLGKAVASTPGEIRGGEMSSQDKRPEVGKGTEESINLL